MYDLASAALDAEATTLREGHTFSICRQRNVLAGASSSTTRTFKFRRMVVVFSKETKTIQPIQIHFVIAVREFISVAKCQLLPHKDTPLIPMLVVYG
tara:strand:- start:82 stop:372 length:291 start_codon:yes stop_codon:yes gene_type:complete